LNQVTGVFPRILGLGVGAVRAASAVLGVLNQRLLRVNCPQCSQAYRPSAESLRWLPHEVARNGRFVRSVGCDSCKGTGFYGRTTVAELLVVNAGIRSAVCSGAPSQELYERAIADGMRTIWQSAMLSVLSGLAPLEEAIAVVGTE
jgi:type II secretory ATPase GspE/PulE/Tfp pilus assembly ATPase PilB-like protein